MQFGEGRTMISDLKITVYDAKLEVMVKAVKEMAEILDSAEGETFGWIKDEQGNEVGEWELDIKY